MAFSWFWKHGTVSFAKQQWKITLTPISIGHQPRSSLPLQNIRLGWKLSSFHFCIITQKSFLVTKHASKLFTFRIYKNMFSTRYPMQKSQNCVTVKQMICSLDASEPFRWLAQIVSAALVDLVYRLHVLFIIQTRITVLTILFTPVVLSYPIWRVSEQLPSFLTIENRIRDSNRHDNQSWWLNWFVWTIESAGPTFTKIGQWASSRVDLFPEEICQALSKLQSNARPHSFAQTKRILEDAYNVSLSQLFSEFDENPIGIGAVAQVYRGTLLRTGQEVAIKIIHPMAHETIKIDLRILETLAKTINFLIPSSHWLSLPEEVAMFGSMMMEQSSMLNEAKYLDIFRSNFKDWDGAVFPTPILELCTENILVEEFIHGIPMSQVLNLGPSVYDKRIARIGLTSFLKMLVLDNHVHADMHPGNMMLTFLNKETMERPSPTEMRRIQSIRTSAQWEKEMESLESNGYSPVLVIVDTGLVSTLSPNHLQNFLDLFRAVVDFNGNRISQLMIERSQTPWTVIDPEGFSATMTSFISRIRDQTLALKHISVSEILAFVLNNVRRHHVKIEGDFANVAISIMLIEGMGRRLDPDADLLKAAIPFLSKVVSSNLSSKSNDDDDDLSWKEWVVYKVTSWL